MFKPMAKMAKDPDHHDEPVNFIQHIIDLDVRSGRLKRPPETRFPPEPNGHLHIGHAKSICLNFGIARDYGGGCHLRFDDTNPENESDEYVRSAIDVVRWLGFEWKMGDTEHLYFASDYYGKLYELAELLITNGLAYVDSQPAGQIQSNRGTAFTPGTNSPYRERSADENLELFRSMRAGDFSEGQHVLRAKIDMTSPNFNLRDPVLYRIRYMSHYRTGFSWCIYPMYDYAHCVADSLENITHSLATLEFEDHRPLYDWILEKLAELGALQKPLPRQLEFSRLNLTYTITSKRKLHQLVSSGAVRGWDDPRMPTLIGLRRRGFTPESIRTLCERVAVTKVDGWIDISVLESALRDDLDNKVPRAFAVLDPLRLIIDNFSETEVEECDAPVHPHHPERGSRLIPLTRELWIERDDFRQNPQSGFFGLYPGKRVRLKYGYVIECLEPELDVDGHVVAIHSRYFPDSKSGTDSAAEYKVKGAIHWLSARFAKAVPVRLYGRLLTEPHIRPDLDLIDQLNPNSEEVLTAYVESAAHAANPEDRFQFERLGYFIADKVDSAASAPVFNRTVSLRQNRRKV
jgi:glutaminyl-tRNA synthetase